MSRPTDTEKKALMFEIICNHGLSLTLCVGDQEVTVAREQVEGAWVEDGSGFARGLGSVCAVLATHTPVNLNGVELDPTRPALVIDPTRTIS